MIRDVEEYTKLTYPFWIGLGLIVAGLLVWAVPFASFIWSLLTSVDR